MSPALTFEPKQSRAVCLLALLLVTWIMVGSSFHGMVQSGVRGGDFQFFYTAAQRLNAHEPLYKYESTGATYVYAPLLAITLRPFVGTHSMARDAEHKLIDPATEGEFLHAQKVWFGASAGSLLLAVGLFARAARLHLTQAAAGCILIVTAFHFWPTVMSLGLGQANLLLVCALAGIYYADSRDKLLLAAVFIAGGAIIKTWFLGFVLYLILRRAWSAIVACGVIYVACLGVLFTIVGWGEMKLFIDMTHDYASKNMGNQVLSQSISGFAQLHFSQNDHIAPLRDSPLLADLTKWTLTALILGGLAFMYFRKLSGKPFERQLRLGVITLSLLLLLPYCQNEYLVLTLPVLWTFLLAPSSSGLLSFGLTCIAYILLTRGGPYYPNDAKPFHDGLRSLFVSLPFFTLMGLWAVTLLALMSRRVTLMPDTSNAPIPSARQVQAESPSSSPSVRPSGVPLSHA